MSDHTSPRGNGSGGAHYHGPSAEAAPPPVDFCTLNLEDVAVILGGRADMHGNVWFPHPDDSDGGYSKCRIAKEPGAPYGLNISLSDGGDKQRVIDFLVEMLGISKESRKLTKAEKLAQDAEMKRRKTAKQAAHAWEIGDAKASHWDGPGPNDYVGDGSGLAGKVLNPAQPVTDDGPECVHKYFEGREIPRPDRGVIKFKPALYVTATDKRRGTSRKELLEPAHIVALTFNALTGAIEGVHGTYIDAEGNAVAHASKYSTREPTRKRTWASNSGVIKLRTVAGAKRLVVAEGIENALSAVLLPELEGCDFWSTSTGFGLQQLPALPDYDELTIIVDIDDGKGLENSTICAKRWHYARKRVYLLRPLPPQGRETDWDLNDVILAPNFTTGCGYEIVEFALAGGGDKPSAVTTDDFVAYMPQHNYIFMPTNDAWPPESVNARLPRMLLLDEFGLPVLDKKGKPIKISAAMWLDKNQPVEQLTWAPGDEKIIRGRLVTNGGWIDRPGAACLNQYRPPTIMLGDPMQAQRWVDHIHRLYPNDAELILDCFAHRRQRPDEKINHALVLGGPPGIGKDTIFEGVRQAVGPWNCSEAKPSDFAESYNPYVKGVITRISEIHDLGDMSRVAFYEKTKDFIAAPPDVLSCNEKYIKHHLVQNTTFVVMTTNHRADSLYLPGDDRRHNVAWSNCVKEDFTDEFWVDFWDWHQNRGGYAHVAAYLATRDISRFNPKAPPPKTEVFWEIVHTCRAPEQNDLADVLDLMGNPDAFVLDDLKTVASKLYKHTDNLYGFLTEKKNARQIPHRMEDCGYVSVRNPYAKDGAWVVEGSRKVIHGKKDLSTEAQLKVVPPMIDKREQNMRAIIKRIEEWEAKKPPPPQSPA
jgi:hypothetical protein